MHRHPERLCANTFNQAKPLRVSRRRRVPPVQPRPIPLSSSIFPTGRDPSPPAILAVQLGETPGGKNRLGPPEGSFTR